MKERYRHTQIGYMTIILSGSGLLAFIVFPIIFGVYWTGFGAVIFFGLWLAFFSRMTVVIEGEVLEIRQGRGVIRKKFPLKDIESSQMVKIPWYGSWAMRRRQYRSIYHVLGSYRSVEIKMKTDEKYLIGTDAPNDLEKAVRKAIERWRDYGARKPN